VDIEGKRGKSHEWNSFESQAMADGSVLKSFHARKSINWLPSNKPRGFN